MKNLYKIGYGVFIVIIIAIAMLFVATLFPIPGNFQVKIVQSGSMEPAIKTGGIVIIKPAQNYSVGDIVTFGKDTKKDIPTTHRITDSRVVDGVLLFTTKGDANEDKDTVEVKEKEIIGKVLFSLPFAGYLIDFAKKPFGFAVMIILPAFIVIYDEGAKIFREIQKMRKPQLAVNQENVGGPSNSSGQEK